MGGTYRIEQGRVGGPRGYFAAAKRVMNRRSFLAPAAARRRVFPPRRPRRAVLCPGPGVRRGIARGVHPRDRARRVPKFDTEANKSGQLATELEREAGRPRCDVHWNNEILGTIRLARKGVYEPYESPRPPASRRTRPADQPGRRSPGGPGADRQHETRAAGTAAAVGCSTSLGRSGREVAVAKPEFGTTATHAACLFEVLGAEAAKAVLRGGQRRGSSPGTSRGRRGGRGAVRRRPHRHRRRPGEVRAGKPVALVFPDRGGHPALPRLGTLFIPNTVAVVRGGPNPGGARRLVDYLLRPETERRLAEGGASRSRSTPP